MALSITVAGRQNGLNILYSFVSLTLAAQSGGHIKVAPGDLPIDGFEKWTQAGTAFSVSSFRAGDKYPAISSADGGLEATGTLTSPKFKIARKYISFQIAGGDLERITCLNLLVGGKIVRSATGRNSNKFADASWDVSNLVGKIAQLELVDEATVEWGYVAVAHLVQTDDPVQLPVVQQPLYHESLRPQFHFTARQWTMDRLNPGPKQEGWINDLNGLIYYDGEYHLFAQRWYKCWLHAVSKDLVHWTELEPAFWEERLESGDQSGTCVVDYANTSGLSPDKSKPPMVAFWSRADNRSQCICYSLDHGRTWARYAKNPIMIRPERDPKVFWYAPGRHWVMMMYGDGQYHVLTSANLLDWKDEHHPIKDSFECPDFFELPIDGDPHNKKWVLIQGNGQYSSARSTVTSSRRRRRRFPCDVGPNFYATQSWANTDTGTGERPGGLDS